MVGIDKGYSTMNNDAFGLVSTSPAIQPFLQALDTATSDTDIEQFMTQWAVLFTDLSGYSAHPVLVDALHRVRQIELALQSILKLSDVMLLKSQGDSHLMLFKQVSIAVKAVEMLRHSMLDNQFCAGIAYGYIILLEHNNGRLDAVGVPINEASKLGEDIAVKDECLLSCNACRSLPFQLRKRCMPVYKNSEIKYYLLLD